ncbi:glycosylase [Simplicispira lacusdiani]|uniref:glycosylase n=1 Tax=Simplicispira lacusdiani TaxID=2213010 RepID=UPI000E743E63|nr:glycosylase [Simplicispira lacusdiani]
MEKATHNWHKLGRIFNPQDVTDRLWLKEFAQAPATLVLDDRVRVYFSCRPSADADGQYTSRSAWVDLDRRDLTRVLAIAEQPILPLGDTGTFDEFGTYPVSVVRDGARVVACYAGWTRCQSVPFNTAIGLAHSDDGGQNFRKAGPGPILSFSPDEPFVLSGPKLRRWGSSWHLFYIAGRKWLLDGSRPEPVYRIRMATSDDGRTWVKANRDLIPVRLGDSEAQASPDVFRGRERFHMFFCYRHGTDYRNHNRGYRIGYAHSIDLLHWTREDEYAGLDVSIEGWDSEMVSYPHVFELDGTIYMLYLGNQVGRWGFGLARLDGTLD